MLLKLSEPLHIEDLRHHHDETAGRLRELLLRGVIATADPQRKAFYDVEDDAHVFYIHITPGGKVLLLGRWGKEGSPRHARSAIQMARTSAA